MMANRTPSSMQFTAAFAACRAAGIRPSAVIEPEQSTMMISVAPAVRGPPEPDEATVTIALTSVAPRARNSFWNASAVYGTRSPLAVEDVQGDEGDGDVVRAARGVGEVDQCAGRLQQTRRFAQGGPDGVGERGRFGQVVPEA